MPVKVVMGWGFNSVGPFRPGFSEVHYYLPAVSNTRSTNLRDAAVNLMNARTQMMGSNVRASVLRMSLVGVPRKAYKLYAAPTAQGMSPLTPGPNVSQGTCDIPNTSVMMELFSALNQRTVTYLAGLPDAFIKTGDPSGPDFGAAGLVNYQSMWNNWLTLLTNGDWGFKPLDLLPAGQPGKISFWQQAIAAPFNAQFILPNTATYRPAVGEIVHIRGVLMATSGATRPIGRWRIIATGAYDANNTFFELDKSSYITTVLIDQPGTVESVTSSYQAYLYTGNLLQVSRKRGVGPTRPRGRSRTRARRQPV